MVKPLPPSFRELVREVYSEWGSGVTGTMSAPLFLWAFIGSGAPRIVCGLLAVFCVYVAAYRVWHKERSDVCKLSGELESIKNQRPDIHGEAHGFLPVKNNYQPFVPAGVSDAGYWCSISIQFKIDACNHRSVETNVRSIVLDGSQMIIPASFPNVSICRAGVPVDIYKPPDTTCPELKRGMTVALQASASMEILGYQLQGLPNQINMSGIAVKLVDGFGNRHQIDVRANEFILI